MAAEAISVDESGALEAQDDASLEHLPEEQRYTTTENSNVYLEEFITVVQGGPRERLQVL